ncbi:hypothetical protein GCM10027064_12980 [Microbacterium petrolearium]
MRRTPPKMTAPVSTATTTPETSGIQPETSAPTREPTAAVLDAAMVLACSALNAKGKQKRRMTANVTPIQCQCAPSGMPGASPRAGRGPRGAGRSQRARVPIR